MHLCDRMSNSVTHCCGNGTRAAGPARRIDGLLERGANLFVGS